MTTELEQLREAISHFSTAMLVSADVVVGLRARPLSIAEHGSDGSLWFLTASDSGKVFDIQEDAQVAVVMQSERRFISLSGFARLDASAERRKALWRESFRPWFPKGPDDGSAIALEVIPKSAELWDLSGGNGIRYVLRALGALVSGKPASDAPDGRYHVQVKDEQLNAQKQGP